jgi:hypothetical protein
VLPGQQGARDVTGDTSFQRLFWICFAVENTLALLIAERLLNEGVLIGLAALWLFFPSLLGMVGLAALSGWVLRVVVGGGCKLGHLLGALLFFGTLAASVAAGVQDANIDHYGYTGTDWGIVSALLLFAGLPASAYAWCDWRNPSINRAPCSHRATVRKGLDRERLRGTG